MKKLTMSLICIVFIVYANISVSAPNQVTAIIERIGEFSESGDGFTFTTKEGKEYYIYVANDLVQGGEYLVESEKKRTPVCLKLKPKDGMGDIAAVSKGACINSNPDKGWYISTAEPALVVRDFSGVTGNKIGSIPVNGEIKVVEKTNVKDSIGGHSGVWVKIEWKNSFGYVFDGFLKPVEKADETSSKEVVDLLKKFYMLNEKCQGGAGDRTMEFCGKRDNTWHLLTEKGWCHGREDQAEYEKVWAKCDVSS